MKQFFNMEQIWSVNWKKQCAEMYIVHLSFVLYVEEKGIYIHPFAYFKKEKSRNSKQRSIVKKN